MEALQALQSMAGDLDKDLAEVLLRRSKNSSVRMYRMLEYFFGFRNEELEKAPMGGGKRFRPTLCLALAEGYGARERAIPAALSIELFHNFTLIHDDIADHDETRRNRPTLWKIFGTDHALNAGDALSLLACELAFETNERSLTDMLLAAYYEVIEGQYLDFESTRGGVPISESVSLETTRKKTGALVRASAEAAGIAAGRVEDELILLRTFGESLGVAFQLADDFRSVWFGQQETGKDAGSDIRERKKTLAYVLAREMLDGEMRARLEALYALERQMNPEEIREARAMIDTTEARLRMKDHIQKHANKAKDAARFLTLEPEMRQVLVTAVENLVQL